MKDLIVVLLVILGVLSAVLMFPKTFFLVVFCIAVLLFFAIRIATTPLFDNQL